MTDFSADLLERAKALYADRKYSGDARPWEFVAGLIEILEATPPKVSSVEELDALPESSAILDQHGDVLQYRGGLWCGYESRPFGSEWVWKKYAPLTLIYTPLRPAAVPTNSDNERVARLMSFVTALDYWGALSLLESQTRMIEQENVARAASKSEREQLSKAWNQGFDEATDDIGAGELSGLDPYREEEK